MYVGKWIYIYFVVLDTQGAQARITQCYLQLQQGLALPAFNL